MTNELKVAIVGPAGDAGLELARRLFRHPRLKTPLLLSPNAKGGGSIAGLLPQLKLNGDGRVHPFSWALVHRSGVDLLFVTGAAARTLAPEAASHGLLVIDLNSAGGHGGQQWKSAVAAAVRQMNAHYGWDDTEGLG